jgi:hypothetical protein
MISYNHRCELQFDYGLRGMRHLSLKKRPEVFKSASGKDITVQKDVAVVNDVTLRKGRVSRNLHSASCALRSLSSRPFTRSWRERYDR